jgi:hypothetical protein
MGKSASAPPTPDYLGAAKQQGQDNLAAAKQSNLMSNPNMYTPFGNQTVSYSNPTFDQGSYDAALAKYNAGGLDRNSFMRTGNPEGDTTTGATYFDQAGYDAAQAKRGGAPDRSGFMTGGGIPTVTQTLTPQAQQTLESQQRVQTALANLGEVGIANARLRLKSRLCRPQRQLSMILAVMVLCHCLQILTLRRALIAAKLHGCQSMRV